ncbi:MAG: AraC family transcriptional regulator [Bacillota bacterium]|nr:AraC family transcriptional regulator [Bacillota bacterium]
MEYLKRALKEDIVISKLVTYHYFEFAKNYVFEGEKHNFWECLYVDKGEVEVMADTHGFKLRQGDIIFHKPNEFHSVWANGIVAPNLIIVSFECKSKAMKFFENKIMQIDEREKDLLGEIISEAKEAFPSYIKQDGKTVLKRKNNSLVGCEQLVKISLEYLFISLLRKGTGIQRESRLSLITRQRFNNDMVKKIIGYMDINISGKLTFEDICRFSGLGSTNLKSLFKETFDMGVMEYYKNLKIEKAKNMIREDLLNFTEIAEKLGYSSIHYFSRHFKKVTGMTPSEYASSVKIKIL